MRTVLATVAVVALLCLTTASVVAEETKEAEEAAAQAEPTVYMAGAGAFEPTDLLFPTPVMVDGVLQSRGGFIEFMVKSDDPRIDGPYRVQPFNMDIDPLTGISRMWGTGHIVREDGSFSGPVAGYTRPVGEGVDAHTGSGA